MPFKKKILFYLSSIFIFTTIIHLPFMFFYYFGEQDAARIANMAIRSYFNGHLSKEYTLYSTPFYTTLLFTLIKCNILHFKYIPLFMSLLTLCSNIIITLCSFIFIFRTTRSKKFALLTSILIQFNPVFWFNSIYGFPSITSIAFFFISLTLFQTSLNKKISTYKILLLFLSLLFYIFALFTKIDTILVSSLFILPVWHLSPSLKKRIVTSFFLLLIAFLCFVLFKTYINLFPDLSKSFDVNNWSDQFPINFRYLFSKTNLNIIFRAMGFSTIPIALISYFFIPKNYRYFYFWILISIIPITLFWGLRDGNSARHNLFPAILIHFLITLPLLNKKIWKKWLSVIIFMCIFNYLYYPPNTSTVCLSGKIFRSSIWTKHYRKQKTEKINETVLLPFNKLAIIGLGSTHPFYIYQMFIEYNFSSFSLPKFKGQKFTMTDANNQSKTFLFMYSAPENLDIIIKIYNEGYFLLIKDDKLLKRIRSYDNFEFDDKILTPKS